MNGRIARALCCILFLAIGIVASDAQAQAPYGRTVTAQASGKDEKSTSRQLEIFCADSSVAQRVMRVGQTDCEEVCGDVYHEYPCELQQRRSEGWKVTSAAARSIIVAKEPCECKVNGTESVLERP